MLDRVLNDPEHAHEVEQPEQPAKGSKFARLGEEARARDKAAKAAKAATKEQTTEGLEDRAELEAMMAQVSLYDLACEDTGENPRLSGGVAYFDKCPVCGHHDDFRVYTATNTWACFSANFSEDGGNVLDYLEHARNLDAVERVKWLRETTHNDYKPKVADGDCKAVSKRPDPKLAITKSDPTKRTDLAPEVIEGFLRLGRVGLVSGASKVGKTWLMLQLAVAVAQGGRWMDTYDCKQGRVLFVNPELAEDMAAWRLRKVCMELGADLESVKANLDFIHGRGIDFGVHDVHETLQADALCQYSLVIFDSIYMLFDGNENDAHDVKRLIGECMRMATELGCAVVITHHHSKGGKAEVSSIDRMSGSGVWARYPDSLVDLMELFPPAGEANPFEGCKVFKFDVDPREYTKPKPVHVFYDFPLHHVDTEGITEGWKARSAVANQHEAGKASGDSRKLKMATDRAENEAKLIPAFVARGCPTEGIKLGEAAKTCDCSPEALKRRLEGSEYFKVEKVSPKRVVVRIRDGVVLPGMTVPIEGA